MALERPLDRAITEPIDVAQPNPAGAQRVARPHHDAARGSVETHNIKRRTGCNTETAPLSDGEMNDAVMPANDAPIEIDDFTRRGGSRPKPLDHISIVSTRHKADVLAVLFIGDRQAEAPRQLPRLCLGLLAKREAQQIELSPRGRRQKIALIALGLARAIKRTATPRQRA